MLPKFTLDTPKMDVFEGWCGVEEGVRKEGASKSFGRNNQKNGEKEERYGGGKLQELIGISTLFDKSS